MEVFPRLNELLHFWSHAIVRLSEESESNTMQICSICKKGAGSVFWGMELIEFIVQLWGHLTEKNFLRILQI